MKLKLYNPKQSLNKAYLKEKVSRESIELFKKNLSSLIVKIDEKESEEHLKNVISEFLKDTWYKETNEINTKDRKDLVIHTGKTTKDPVGVILEVKKPSNKSEMITEAKPNAKALHELILYYLRERTEHNNIDIKYLVITNIYEWFIFDEVWFEKNVFRNTKLKKDFENWKLSGNDTKFFYENIAKPFVETITDTVECTYFDVRPFEEVIKNEDKKDDNKLIALYKILSPVHLLKLPFANDSNTLDTKFYSELLHIIGLEEVKEGGKKLIKRKEKPDPASILENTIMKLEDKDSLRSITNLSSFGVDKKEQLFNVALELSITWINRVLFLKLLEAQLYKYHKGNESYLFLNHKTIHDFDELSNLFFQVLAERQKTRREHLKDKFKNVPYLNSSLFERTDLERQTFDISGLDNRLELPLISSTVLKNEAGKRKTGKLATLQYLFDFLDSYDFTSEGSEEIQEQNKNLINASVLGLIFEKINGYKDGSFFTPGFVTMYMCRETIRRSVVQKFNDQYNIDCESFDDLKNYIASKFKVKDILEFNKVINDLKICDPAVGSGHFLVSALNEIIAVKAELGILADKEGLRLTGYDVKIENDELIVTYNDNTEIFEYSVTSGSIAKETQRVQKTLFHEKESIIENSLFGVDINPNSVKICRLRLWIELLKNAYYTEESNFTELETLPNIDINIKCGNSLISRFPLDADLKKALKGKWNIDTYKIAVHSYHEAENKEEKRKLEELIETIKKDFRTEIGSNDPRRKKLLKLKEELFLLTVSPKLELDVEMKKGGVKLEKEKVKKISEEVNKIEKELKEIENNKIFENAFEWRFEFPEILNNNGEFIGFDVIIGNPPYISALELKKSLPDLAYKQLKTDFQTAKGTVDLFIYFFEKGIKLIKDKGQLTYITPNRYLSASYGEALREYLFKNTRITEIVDYSHVKVFAEASTYPIVTSLLKTAVNHIHYPISVGKYNSIADKIETKLITSEKLNLLEGYIWGYLLNDKIEITEKVFSQSVSITQCATINATSTASEADAYHDLINEKSGFKLINTGTIDRYETTWGKETLTDKGKRFLKPYLKKDPNVVSANRLKLYKSSKIILAKIAIRTEAFYDSEGEYASVNTNCLHSFTDEFDPRYVLAWINSKLFQYTFECFFEGLKMQGGYLLYSAPNVSKMAIKRITLKEQERYIKYVDEIIDMKKQSKDSKALEKKIDDMFYREFELSDLEIKIIEGV